MARIAEAEVERLKREVSVQRLAEARGIKLTAAGGGPVGLCPFHDDRTPSLVITPAKILALPGRVQYGRHGHRLGDAGRGHQLPPCGRVAARRTIFPLAAAPVRPVKQSTVREASAAG